MPKSEEEVFTRRDSMREFIFCFKSFPPWAGLVFKTDGRELQILRSYDRTTDRQPAVSSRQQVTDQLVAALLVAGVKVEHK